MALAKMIDQIVDADDAALVAIVAHGNQCDFKGRPYFFHPIRVAEAAWMKGLSSEAVCAALLHDTVEDNAQMNTSLVEALAGPRVGHLVDLLTRREGQTYEQFIERIIQSGDYEAAQIKICDIKDNLRDDRRLDGGEKERARRERYHAAVERLLAVKPNTGSRAVPSGTVGNRLAHTIESGDASN